MPRYKSGMVPVVTPPPVTTRQTSMSQQGSSSGRAKSTTMTRIRSRAAASADAREDAVARIQEQRFKEDISSRTKSSSSCTFRLAARIYAERKLVIVALIHFVATIVVWAHFFLMKFNQTEESVPYDANRYWLKRLVPPFEFGAMHAILFQMAILPLTMSRLSIAAASTSIWNNYFPFNRMTRFHIHLGYVVVATVVVSTLVFFIFFGLLCSDGEQQFCDKFTTEMMITGYVLLSMLLVVAITSFFRHSMQYEIFYAVHHLVFFIYILAIIHTFDQAQRTNEKDRSQTFRWFAVPLLYYVCDRAAMYISHRYNSSIIASSAITSSKGTRMIVMKIRRPLMFFFKSGQYCLLRIPAIDQHWWHPFSISSGPNSNTLEFCAEVHSPSSWTNKLWGIIKSLQQDTRRAAVFPSERHCRLLVSKSSIEVELKGPYGAAFGNLGDYSHVLAIGGGSGIVPILSLLKHHVYHIRELEPQIFLRDCIARNKKISTLHSVQSKTRGTMWGKAMVLIRGRRKNEGRDNSGETRTGRGSVHASIALLLVPALGTTTIGLTLSWNTIPIEVYPFMVDSLKIVTVLFQSIFAAVTVFVQDCSVFLTYLDVAIIIISAFADWYWFAMGRWGSMNAGDLVYSSLLLGYMTLRTWHTAVKRRRSRSWRNEIRNGCIASKTMDKLTFVWVTRSASLVSKIMPDIIHIWNSLCDSWGTDAANKVCNISIYITEKDEEACDALKSEIGGSSLFKSGAVRFGPPDIQNLIADHTLDRINSERGVPTTTLLAFCGSPSLASVIQQAKIANDISAVVTGNGHHQMEFASESYGPVQKRRTNYYRTSHGEEDIETASSLSQQGWDDCIFSRKDIGDDTTKFADLFF